MELLCLILKKKKNQEQRIYGTRYLAQKFLPWMKQAWQHFQHARIEELFDPNLMLHNYHTSNAKKGGSGIKTIHNVQGIADASKERERFTCSN